MREKVDPAEIPYLADRAVQELIEDSKSSRINKNRELAEVIVACLRKLGPTDLEDLKGLLGQRSLERADLQHKHPKFRADGDLKE
jgi:hypothetical protein